MALGRPEFGWSRTERHVRHGEHGGRRSRDSLGVRGTHGGAGRWTVSLGVETLVVRIRGSGAEMGFLLGGWGRGALL